MASPEQLSLIKQGVKEWNNWRKTNSLIPVDLSTADLKGLDLEKIALWDANLEGANLTQSNLSKCDLRGANLQRANLFESNLSKSDLRNANFSQANLSKAILSEANLGGAFLIQVNLHDTNFTDSILTAACFYNCLINQNIVLNNVNCSYIYLSPNKLNRYPQDGNLSRGEFAQIVQKDFISAIDEPIIKESKSDNIFEQIEKPAPVKLNNQLLEKIAVTIGNLIEEIALEIPESATRHVKIATRVISILQNNPEFLTEFQQLKAENKLEELEVLIPNQASKLIIIGLKK